MIWELSSPSTQRTRRGWPTEPVGDTGRSVGTPRIRRPRKTYRGPRTTRRTRYKRRAANATDVKKAMSGHAPKQVRGDAIEAKRGECPTRESGWSERTDGETPKKNWSNGSIIQPRPKLYNLNSYAQGVNRRQRRTSA